MSTAQAENPYAGQGSVLLDIGGDVGALVVTMPEEMAGIEVEIKPEGADFGPAHEHEHAHGHDHGHAHSSQHPHVAVVSRPVDGSHVPSLVFPELVEGSYELYEKNTQDIHLTVTIRGGEVATASW